MIRAPSQRTKITQVLRDCRSAPFQGPSNPAGDPKLNCLAQDLEPQQREIGSLPDYWLSRVGERTYRYDKGTGKRSNLVWNNSLSRYH